MRAGEVKWRWWWRGGQSLRDRHPPPPPVRASTIHHVLLPLPPRDAARGRWTADGKIVVYGGKGAGYEGLQTHFVSLPVKQSPQSSKLFPGRCSLFPLFLRHSRAPLHKLGVPGLSLIVPLPQTTAASPRHSHTFLPAQRETERREPRRAEARGCFSVGQAG